MVEIYKRQENLTPEAKQVESFLRGIDDNHVLDELQKRRLSAKAKKDLDGKIKKSELSTQLFEHMKQCTGDRRLYSRMGQSLLA